MPHYDMYDWAVKLHPPRGNAHAADGVCPQVSGDALVKKYPVGDQLAQICPSYGEAFLPFESEVM